MTTCEGVFRPKRLVVVRHAESLWNAAAPDKENKKFRGAFIPPELEGVPDWDVSLSAWGTQQAIETGQALEKICGEFETVYYSPWFRTTQTAELIVDEFSEPARLKMKERLFRNLNLVEQNFGVLDAGIDNTASMMTAYEDFYAKRRRLGPRGKFWLAPSNGESWWHVCRRTHEFLDTVFRPNRHGQSLLIVTHGVTMQTFRYHLERMDEETLVTEYQKDKNKNCGVSCYEWNESLGRHGRYELKFWNQTFYNHLVKIS